jgi:hypothetical protein
MHETKYTIGLTKFKAPTIQKSETSVSNVVLLADSD